MNSPISLSHETPDILTVAFWNILLDRKNGDAVAPQDHRLEELAKTIIGLEVTPDVMGIVEAEAIVDKKKNILWHNGIELARMTGNNGGVWDRHSRAREYLGMFGPGVSEVAFEDLGGKKVAITHVGKIAVATTHFRKELRGPIRSNQARLLMEYMQDEEYGVIMLDRNDLPAGKSNRIIESHGYISAFDKANGRLPRTMPTKKYRHILSPLERLAVGWGGLAIDDILVTHNLDVLRAETFEGDSDHKGLWAEIKLPV